MRFIAVLPFFLFSSSWTCFPLFLHLYLSAYNHPNEPSIHPSVNLFIHQFIHSYICSSVHPSVPVSLEGQGQYYGYGGANGGGGGGNDLLDLMDDEPAAVSVPASRSASSGTSSPCMLSCNITLNYTALHEAVDLSTVTECGITVWYISLYHSLFLVHHITPMIQYPLPSLIDFLSFSYHYPPLILSSSSPYPLLSLAGPAGLVKAQLVTAEVGNGVFISGAMTKVNGQLALVMDIGD